MLNLLYSLNDKRKTPKVKHHSAPYIAEYKEVEGNLFTICVLPILLHHTYLFIW